MSQVKVNLGPKSYSVIIGNKILGNLGRSLKKLDLDEKVFIVTNPVIKALPWFRPIEDVLRRSGYEVSVFPVPEAGEFRKKPDLEEFKDSRMVMRLYNKFLAQRLDRSSTVMTVGGGVTEDLAGYAASTYMRGINLVHVPTSLLAQVDSAIGGKTGVNLPQGKNLIGTFYQPRLVYIDIEVLRTSPVRELRCGFSEIIKYGMIKDKTFFRFLEKNARTINSVIDNIKKNRKILAPHTGFLLKVITRCCQIKAWVVERDEEEKKGLREILNYGHTVGHGLEAATKYKKFHHGEAISIGMVAAARVAHKMGNLRLEEAGSLENLLGAVGLPTRIDPSVDLEEVMKAIKVDKKARGGRLRFVLPTRIGQVAVTEKVSFNQLGAVLKELMEGGDSSLHKRSNLL